MRLCVKDVCYWKCGDTTCYRRACCPITKMGNFDDKSQLGWRKMISRTILLLAGKRLARTPAEDKPANLVRKKTHKIDMKRNIVCLMRRSRAVAVHA